MKNPFRDLYSDTPTSRRVTYVGLFFLCLLAVWQASNWLQQQKITALTDESYQVLGQLTSVIESSLSTYQHIPTLLASHKQVLTVLKASKAAHDQEEQESYQQLGYEQPSAPIAEQQHYETELAELNQTLEQINRITESSDSYIIDAYGDTLAASNYNTDTSFIGKNFAYRPYFQEAMVGKSGRYYALGSTTKRRGYYFSYPVIEQGVILGVAVVKIELGQLEARLANNKYDFLMRDPDGVIFSSSRPKWIYRTLQPLPQAAQIVVEQSQRYGGQKIGVMPLLKEEKHNEVANILVLNDADNQSRASSYLYISEPISNLGFQVDLLVPLTPIEQDILLWRTMLIGLIMILVLVLLSIKLRQKMLNERTKAHEIRLHNQVYIQEIVNNTQAGLVTLDAKQQIESYNPAVERLVNCALDEVMGQPLDALFTATEEKRVISMSGTFSVTACEGYLHFNPAYKVAVEMTLCRMALPDSLKYLVTFHDMRERKRYEQEIILAQTALEQRVKERTFELEQTNDKLRNEINLHKDTQQELIQTAKMAVLGQLSAGLNHELNQPLTAIRSFAENALKFIQRDNIKQVDGNLQQIVQLSSHMRDIIARFKVFARKGSFHHSPVLLETAIKGALNIMLPRLKEADIAFILPKMEQQMVLGDLVLIEQVIVNLIANAIDAIEEACAEKSGEKGTACTRAERTITVLLNQTEPDWLEFGILDSGGGFVEGALAHIFDPFYSSKTSGVGLGLGLSISQRIIESMGGTIQAENQYHGVNQYVEGAVFRIKLKRFIPY
ncbi:PAS domain-containing sensor histidine kinase [Marinomonas agarivorans]|nr:PAS domain-containing sensor histidine kinase [Marinomonas agarivorans]